MPQNADPDELLVVDLGIFRRKLIERLGADQVICEQDMAVIRAFDEPYDEIKQRTRVRHAFESIMTNGVTRHTSQLAKKAGLALIVGPNRKIADVRWIDPDPQSPEAA